MLKYSQIPDAVKLVHATANPGEYDERVVAPQYWTRGLGISTCWTVDQGYETAILDANRGVHPVERYSSKEEAVEGHKRWTRKVREGLSSVEELGYGSLTASRRVGLHPLPLASGMPEENFEQVWEWTPEGDRLVPEEEWTP